MKFPVSVSRRPSSRSRKKGPKRFTQQRLRIVQANAFDNRNGLVSALRFDDPKEFKAYKNAVRSWTNGNIGVRTETTPGKTLIFAWFFKKK